MDAEDEEGISAYPRHKRRHAGASNRAGEDEYAAAVSSDHSFTSADYRLKERHDATSGNGGGGLERADDRAMRRELKRKQRGDERRARPSQPPPPQSPRSPSPSPKERDAQPAGRGRTARASAPVEDPLPDEQIAPEDEEPERKETIFKSMHAFDFSSYVEPQPPDPRNPNFCALCFFSIPANQKNQPNKFQGLLNYMSENRCKVHPIEFVKTVQDMYITGVQKYLMDENNRRYDGPPWMAEEIWNHDSRHVRSCKGIMREMMETNLWTLRGIRDNETYSRTRFVDAMGNETWKESVNTGKAMIILKLSKEIMTMANKLAPFENHYMV
jgi:hypothetical protein